MAHKLSFVSFLVLFHLATCERGCPPPADINPCSCFDDGTYVDLKCRNITDTDKMVEVFENAKRYHFNKFTLEQSTLQYIPNVIFDDVEVVYMTLDAVSFVNTFDKVPNDPGLKEIFIRRVHVMRGWDWKKLSAFSKLERLILLDIPLGKLSTEFRPNISKKLKYLSFEWCQIKKLRADEFADFHDLERIEISHDEIEAVQRSVFPARTKINYIAMDYNRISTIPGDLFKDMPDLGYVSFKGNQISVLSEDTFRPVMGHLRYLDARDNPLKCDCRIVWLLHYRHLNLSGKCYAPKSLNGVNLYMLKPEDFNC